MQERVTIQIQINAPAKKVWEYYTKPEHITKWSSTSEDWHTTYAENDLRVGGKFLSRMESRDGKKGFDFSGIYNNVIEYKSIKYTMSDSRQVSIALTSETNKTNMKIIFDSETENPIEFQKEGWQSILDNFKKYVESEAQI
jgi:uncharacterized protein YndB with AHSA1/START domain